MPDLALPDFYLVGAPKCGTSALYDFLAQHPAIFLPAAKELLFYATDLSYPSRLDRSRFLAHYSGANGAKRVGTAHTAYMQSRTAAAEIHAGRPDARIIIMLRNPVDLVYSWHSELVYETIEDVVDFGAALEAEPDRRAGRRIPANARNSYLEALFYTDVAALAGQVERYLWVFGRESVHVIVHDDFRRDPGSTYRDVLDFLEVDPSFRPQFGDVNVNKVVRNRTLQRLYFATSSRGHATVRALIPASVRQRLLAWNAAERPRPDMPSDLRRRLTDHFAPDVRRLGDLLQRDLTHWTEPS